MSQQKSGFTIVELLIVIVVIAILAAITIVAYNGIQQRANDSSVQSDLVNVGKKLAAEAAIAGSLPATSDSVLSTLGLKVSKEAYSRGYFNGTSYFNFLYCRGGDNSSFALIAWSKSGNGFMNLNGSVRSIGWDGTGGSAAMCSSTNRAGISPYTAYWLYSSDSWANWL